MNQSSGVVVAPIGRRFGAAFIDRLVPGLIVGLWSWLLTGKQVAGWLIYSVGFSVLLFGWVLVQWWLYATRKAGLGFRVFHLELVGLNDGKAIGWGRMCLRSLILYALWFTLVGGVALAIFLVVQERRMGWHDLAVKSLAIARIPKPAPAMPTTQATGRRSSSTVGLPAHLMGANGYAGPGEIPTGPMEQPAQPGRYGDYAPQEMARYAPPGQSIDSRFAPAEPAGPARSAVPGSASYPDAPSSWAGPQPPGAPYGAPQQPSAPAGQDGYGYAGAGQAGYAHARGTGSVYGTQTAYGAQSPPASQGAPAGQGYDAGPAVPPAGGYSPPGVSGAPASYGMPGAGSGVPAGAAGYPDTGSRPSPNAAGYGAQAAPAGHDGPQSGTGQTPGRYGAGTPLPTGQPPTPLPGQPGGPAVRVRPRPAFNDDTDGTRLVAATARGARPADEGWHVRLDDGRDVPVAGLVLIGRSPAAKDGEQDANLVSAGEPAKTVSKTHLALNVDHRGLFVVDRGSTNGTALRDPDGGLSPCAANSMVRLGEGSVVSFGERSLQVLRYPPRRD